MKIRIKDNTIRFRLSQTEVQVLLKEEQIQSQTVFPNGNIFVYSLVGVEEEDNARIENNIIEIQIEKNKIKHWATTNDEGIYLNLKIPQNNDLKIAVEKDFKCLQERENEDESDLFDNPNEGKINC